MNKLKNTYYRIVASLLAFTLFIGIPVSAHSNEGYFATSATPKEYSHEIEAAEQSVLAFFEAVNNKDYDTLNKVSINELMSEEILRNTLEMQHEEGLLPEGPPTILSSEMHGEDVVYVKVSYILDSKEYMMTYPVLLVNNEWIVKVSDGFGPSGKAVPLGSDIPVIDGGSEISEALTRDLEKYKAQAEMDRRDGVVLSDDLIPTDISGHWAKADIYFLVAMDAVTGYPDKTFRPENPITRAEFTTMLAKALGFTQSSGDGFTDAAGHWASVYIAAASEQGLVRGYDEFTFKPDAQITRQEIATIVARAKELPIIGPDPEFTDSSEIATWAKSAVSSAVANGVITGYPDNAFRPQNGASKAEAVTMLMRALAIWG